MTPRPVPRTYGSIEDFSTSRLTSSSSDGGPTSISSTAGALTQSSAIPDPRWERRRKWTQTAVICGLAAGVVSAVMRSGGTINSDEVRKDDLGSKKSFTGMGLDGAPPPSSSTTARNSMHATGAFTEQDSSKVLPPLKFTALNLYHVRDGKPAQDYPWLKDVKLIEPHRETTLSVTHARQGYGYRWGIRGGSSADEVHTTATGAEVFVLLTRLDENVVVLEELDGDGKVTRRLHETVMVKYVRREIRSLTDDDREELLDAMLVLWEVRVQGGNGREIYGEHYSDIWAINRLHFKAASLRVCDHFHDGLGFLVSHTLLSNTFEFSLQQVNPKLTLPYWDFTIESSSAGAAAGSGTGDGSEPQMESPLWQTSWFGTHDPVDKMVKDGRWAFTEIPKIVQNNPDDIDQDIYGKLRAPWNINERAFLTRALGEMCDTRSQDPYPWPTCAMHHELVTSYDDFFSWVWGSQYDSHGPVHVWIGGVLDCADTFAEVADLVGEDIAHELATLAFVHRKTLYRERIFSCEGSVDVSQHADEVLASGVCGCHGFDLTKGDDYIGIMKVLPFMEEYLAGIDADTKRKLVNITCTSPVNNGDHLQASSSLDPTFWPIHPTTERLWMFSVLTGKVTDFHWPDSDAKHTASDGTICTASISMYYKECLGHRGSDVFPYGLLDGDTNGFTVQTGIKGNIPGGGNKLTNREILAGLDPNINALPYVYDNFEWKHCDDDGVFMDDAWLTVTDEVGDEAEATGAITERVRVSAKGPKDWASVEGKVVFESDPPRYPMYGSLRAKMRRLKKRKGAAR